MTRAWIFNRPVLFENGLAGKWKPATTRVMKNIKINLQELPPKDHLNLFTAMVMQMLKLDSEFHQDGIEQGFVVAVRGGDGAYSCCRWRGNRDWS